jgi:hypothetical protein
MGIVLRDGEARLLLSDVSGGNHALVLSAVERLRAADFREGNIILDVVVRAVENGDGESLKELFDLGTTERDAELLANLINRSKSTKLLVEVNPSYGCSVLALCGQVEVQVEE